MDIFEAGNKNDDDNPPPYEHPPSYEHFAHERPAYLDEESYNRLNGAELNATDEPDKPSPMIIRCGIFITLVLIIASAITIAFIIVVILAWFRMLY